MTPTDGRRRPAVSRIGGSIAAVARAIGSKDRRVLSLYLVLLLAIQLRPTLAWAAPLGGALSGLSLTDSKGISADRYVLSFYEGNAAQPDIAALAFVINLVWAFYVFGISALGFLLETVTRMEWVTQVIGPLEAASTHLRNAVLAPVGATALTGSLIGLFLFIAGAVAGAQILRGRSRGWLTIVESAIAATLAVGVLAAPVAAVAGTSASLAEPLVAARDFGRQLSIAAVTGTMPTPEQTQQVPTHGAILIDAFVRPIHQQVNYGDVIDTSDPDCAVVYDDALKSARTVDELKAVRDKIGDADQCDDRFKSYTDKPTATWVTALLLFMTTNTLLNLLIGTFIVMLCLAVIMLGWASLQLMFHIVVAILPGQSKGPALRDLIDIAISLLYIAISQLLLGVVMAAIKAVFSNSALGDITVRYMIILVLELAGIVMLIAAWVQHRKGGQGLLQKLSTTLRQRPPGPSSAQRAWNWAAAPAPAATSLAMTAAHGGPAPGGGAGVGARLGALTNSNAGRVAITAAKVGAGVASGGSTLAVTAGTAAKSAATKGAQAAARRTYATVTNVKAASQGSVPPVKTGPASELAAIAVGRAHRKVADSISVVKTGWTGQDGGRGLAPTTGNAKRDAVLLAAGANLSNRHDLRRTSADYTGQAEQNLQRHRALQHGSGRPAVTVASYAKNMADAAVTQTKDNLGRSIAGVKQTAVHARARVDRARQGITDGQPAARFPDLAAPTPRRVRPPTQPGPPSQARALPEEGER